MPPATNPQKGSNRLLPLVGIVAVTVLFIVGFSTGWFGLAAGSGVAVKGGLNDYSWEELSKISKEIAGSGDEQAALRVAGRYHLVGENGRLDGSQTKSLRLNDGTETTVQIAGFCHDTKTEGGKAGLTFVFCDAIAKRPMNTASTNAGGWEASSLRSWLGSEGVLLLPYDLQARLVAVDKLSNNTGETMTSKAVTTTSDYLWLFSLTELCGTLDGDALPTADVYESAIFDAEGTQYELFQNADINLFSANSALVKQFGQGASSWWERSANPASSNQFLNVQPNGTPYSLELAEGEGGVLPGFCL